MTQLIGVRVQSTVDTTQTQTVTMRCMRVGLFIMPFNQVPSMRVMLHVKDGVYAQYLCTLAHARVHYAH